MMIIAVGIGWRYASPQTRERLLGFIGAAGRTDPAEVTRGIKDKIIPEDPALRRAALTAALKQKISEIQSNAGVEKVIDRLGAPVSAVAPDAKAARVVNAADEAARLVSQLEQANHDALVGGQIVRLVLNAIIPAPQCKE